MSKAKDPDSLLAELSLPLRAVMQRLRTLVKKRAPKLDEQVKWGGLCYVGRGVVCYAHPLEEHVDFGFFQGARLDDPASLLQGKGKFLRHVKVRKPADVKEAQLLPFLKQALELDARSRT
jgi:hypothetical protein